MGTCQTLALEIANTVCIGYGWKNIIFCLYSDEMLADYIYRAYRADMPGFPVCLSHGTSPRGEVLFGKAV